MERKNDVTQRNATPLLERSKKQAFQQKLGFLKKHG